MNSLTVKSAAHDVDIGKKHDENDRHDCFETLDVRTEKKIDQELSMIQLYCDCFCLFSSKMKDTTAVYPQFTQWLHFFPKE